MLINGTVIKHQKQNYKTHTLSAELQIKSELTVDKAVKIHCPTKQNTNQDTGKRTWPNPDSAGRTELSQKRKGLIQARDGKQGAASLLGKRGLFRGQEDPYQEDKSN